jgi:hypothetical protein
MSSKDDERYFYLVCAIYNLLPDADWRLQPKNPLAPSLMKILMSLCICLSCSQMDKLVEKLCFYKDIPEKAVEMVLRYLYTYSLFDADIENCTWGNLFHYLEGTYTKENHTVWVAGLYVEHVEESEWETIIGNLQGMIIAEIDAVRRKVV